MQQHILQQDWEKRYNALYGYFYRRVNTRDEVEDLVMETLEVFFLNQKEIANQNAYMWGIAKNKLLVYIRNKTKTIPLTDELEKKFENLDQSVNSSEDVFLENYRSQHYQQKMNRLKTCIENQLNLEDQQIVKQSIMDDLKSAEVAINLGIRADNVRQRLSRALRKLREKCRQLWLEEDYSNNL